MICQGLTKDYGRGRGIFDLDLEVAQGEILGLVGPNGAGKTTAIRLLMDLIRADCGTATVLGLDSHRDSIAIKRRTGYLPGELPQYSGVSAGYIIGMLAGLRGGVDHTRINDLADRLHLDLSGRYNKLSHGNKQKVHIVAAFMHRPDLLILDEPTIGLDPLVQQTFRTMVTESVGGGATVLLSSHVLSEIESVCDRVAIVREGRLFRVGSLAELRTVRAHQIEAVVRSPRPISELAGIPGVAEPHVGDQHAGGTTITCTVHGQVGPLMTWLTTCDVEEIDSRELSLEEVFLSEFTASSST